MGHADLHHLLWNRKNYLSAIQQKCWFVRNWEETKHALFCGLTRKTFYSVALSLAVFWCLLLPTSTSTPYHSLLCTRKHYWLDLWYFFLVLLFALFCSKFWRQDVISASGKPFFRGIWFLYWFILLKLCR